MPLHNPADEALFPFLPLDRVLAARAHGEEVSLAPGEILFEEGTRNYPFCIVLEGRLRMTRRIFGQETLLVIHEPGQFTGEISIFTGGAALATARAEGPTKILRFSFDQFIGMISRCADLAATVLRAFAARAHEVDAVTADLDKMASLGKIAAGLAHELNNPAAALVRSASAARDLLDRVTSLGLQCDCRLTSEQRSALTKVQARLRERAANGDGLDPLERSDREEALAAWLESRGVADGCRMASPLVAAGITEHHLESAIGQFTPEALSAALAWTEAGLTAAELAGEIDAAATHISELVQAMKQHTYVDQAHFQSVDIHDGLEATLRLYAHRMKTGAGVEVRRDYDRSLPKICAYAGELNQAWSNLIANAIDAMKGSGVLTISTRREGENVAVTIGDNGPGIPPEIRDRLFQRYFTTKPVGQGTGLGLEMVRRTIVNRHHGEIALESRPGDTRFTVRLPFQQPKDDEMYSHRSDPGLQTALERI